MVAEVVGLPHLGTTPVRAQWASPRGHWAPATSGAPPTLGLPPLQDPAHGTPRVSRPPKSLKARGAEFPRLDRVPGHGTGLGVPRVGHDG
jgi:hypothetical protein